MTIKFTDSCPNCGKNIQNHIEELDEKFFEPFMCPYCKSTLELKKNKFRIIAFIATLWVITLISSVWCDFETLLGCPSVLKEIPSSLNAYLLLIIFGLLWMQDLRIVKSPPQK